MSEPIYPDRELKMTTCLYSNSYATNKILTFLLPSNLKLADMAIPDGSSAQGSIKRYITTHNPNGKSVYLQSCPQIWRSLPDVGKVSRSYAVEKIPVNLQDDTDVNIFKASSGQASYTTPDIVVAPQGANLSIVELEPGGSSTMHQTKSIDFSICVSGVIDHELDGGETVRLNPGVSDLVKLGSAWWQNANGATK